MRDFIAHAKRLDNGEWVEGNLFVPDKPDTPTQICIGTNIVRITYDVDPSTIGWYTGVKDKNGKRIFEGDIVKHYCSSVDKTVFNVGKIYWCENICQYIRTSRIEGRFYDVNTSCEYEVIGNVHDNPELLKGSVDN